MADTLRFLTEAEQAALDDSLLELEVMMRARLRRRMVENPLALFPWFCADRYYEELRRG